MPPKLNPRDPLVPILGERLSLSMLVAGISFPELEAALRRQRVTMSFQSLAGITAGRQRRTRRSVRAAIAKVCGVDDSFLEGSTDAVVVPVRLAGEVVWRVRVGPSLTETTFLDPDRDRQSGKTAALRELFGYWFNLAIKRQLFLAEPAPPASLRDTVVHALHVAREVELILAPIADALRHGNGIDVKLLERLKLAEGKALAAKRTWSPPLTPPA